MDTGLQGTVGRDAASVAGQHFIQADGPANETKYKQAVAAGSINIGKVVDTSDDTTRLTLITSYQSSETVRVFVDMANDETLNGMLGPNQETRGQPLLDLDADDDVELFATAKSIGRYYKAEDGPAPTGDDAPVPTDFPDASTGDGHLDAYDLVTVDKAKGEEIFALTATVDVNGVATEVTRYARIENTKEGDDGPVIYYQPVDIIADVSQTDDGDSDSIPENLHPVTAPIAMAKEYSHIHFGLWAKLNAKGAAIDDLGIGFVQNHDKSGVTTKQGIGTATYHGDWVAAVRRQYASDAEAGAIKRDDGKADLTADFLNEEFTGTLHGLATLRGEMTGNGFSGTTATASHEDLDSDGQFDGGFSGNIYGPTGSEAAGVFAFDGKEAGAFVGAFGGTNQK